MGERDRARAFRKAVRRGEFDRDIGVPFNAPPYKRDGSWSQYPAWAYGWTTRDAEIQADKALATADTPEE